MSGLLQIIQWMTGTVEGQVTLAICSATLLAGAWYGGKFRRQVRAAEKVVAAQSARITQKQLDDFDFLSRSMGKQEVARRELEQIRRRYGSQGVRVGHLAWIMMKFDGRVAADATAPSFGSE